MVSTITSTPPHLSQYPEHNLCLLFNGTTKQLLFILLATPEGQQIHCFVLKQSLPPNLHTQPLATIASSVLTPWLSWTHYHHHKSKIYVLIKNVGSLLASQHKWWFLQTSTSMQQQKSSFWDHFVTQSTVGGLELKKLICKNLIFRSLPL